MQSSVGGRVTYARAMGPMQFLPGTWARYASDGDGDGKADPQNLFDASLAAARYLCSGGLNLRDPSQVMAAILRYNNSMPYAQNVLGWAAAYATGVVPVDLPPITGPPPPLGDAHQEHPEGLGPGCRSTCFGLPSRSDDPMRCDSADRLRPASPPAVPRRPPNPWCPPPSAPVTGPGRGQPGCKSLIRIGPAQPVARPDRVRPRRLPPAAPAPTRDAPDAVPAGGALPPRPRGPRR